MKRKYLSKTRQHCSGAALVEAAFILPLFLLVLIGMFEVSRILFTIQCLDRSARAGAREGAVEISSASVQLQATAAANNSLATCGLNDGLTAVAVAVVPVLGGDGVTRPAVRVTLNRTFNFIFRLTYPSGGSVQTISLFPANTPLTSVATFRKEA